MISLIKVATSFAVFFICFVLPSILFAQEVQEYVPIVTIPGVNENQNTSTGFNSYVNALYIFAITAGALLAVLKLVGAGVKYMFSDIITTKMDAIKDIKGALLGLLLIIGAVVILNTVNTSLTNVDLNVDTLEDLPSGDIDIRIIDVIEMCDETPDCHRSHSMTETGCTNANGYFISGYITNLCIYISRGPTSCPDGEVILETLIPYGIERSCVPVDEYPDTTENITEVDDPAEIVATIATLEDTPGYTYLPGGNSELFNKTDSAQLTAVKYDCIRYFNGNHFEIFEINDQYFLSCWRYETPS